MIGTRFSRARLFTLLFALHVLAAPVSARTWEQNKSPDPPVRSMKSPDEKEATSHHGFSELDRWLQVFEDPGRDKWQKPEKVVRALGIRNGDLLVDLGAGTGYFTVHLARAAAPDGAVLAVDIEAGMIQYIGERTAREGIGNITPVLARPDDPMLPPGLVDLVFLCDTYHHIDDRLDYLRALRHNLTEEGRLAVIDFYKKEIPVGPPAAHKLSREQVISEFEAAGFDLVKEKKFLPYQYFLIFQPR